MDLGKVRQLCEAHQIRWSEHGLSRMFERDISRSDVLLAIQEGEIIEDYPDAWPHPAALVFGNAADGRVLHVVVGLSDVVHIVSCYYPNTITFMPDMRTRRS